MIIHRLNIFFLKGGRGEGVRGEDVNDRDNPDEACVDNPDKLAQKRLLCRVIQPMDSMDSITYLRSRYRHRHRRDLSSSLLLI